MAGRNSKKRDIDAVDDITTGSGNSNPFAVLRSIKKKSLNGQASSPAKEENAAKRKTKKLNADVNAPLPLTIKDAVSEENFILNSGAYEKVNMLFSHSLRTVKDERSQILLLKLKSGQAVKVKGYSFVSAIQGTIDILGYRVSSASHMEDSRIGFYAMYSPSITSHLTVRAYASKAINYDVRQPMWIEKSALPHLSELLEQLDPKSEDVVIAFKSISSNIDKMEALIPVYRNIFTEPIPCQPSIRGLYFLDPKTGQPPIQCSHIWEQHMIQVLTSSSESNIPTIAIVGGRNHGKSTLARYVVNRLFSKYSEVAYLDCDLGQPEFTMSGCMSLLRLQSPILGPPCTHPRNPVHSLFVGSLHPKTDPDYYISCFTELVHRYRTDFPHLPLVINTAGWVKGLGYDVLVHCLRSIQPKFVFQLQKPEYPETPDQLNIVRDIHTEIEGVPMETKQIDLASQSMRETKSKWNAADLRVLSTASYFFSASLDPLKWEFDIPLSHRVPYSVPFNHIRIKFIYDDINCSQILASLNGEIVALVSDANVYNAVKESVADHNKVTSIPQDSLGLKWIPNSSPLVPSKQNCLGFGIIRHISSQKFYIITPVAAERLSRVNLIVRSSAMELPTCLRISGYEHNWSDHNIPYCSISLSIYSTEQQGAGSISSYGETPLGAKAQKSRALGRKRFS